MVQFIVGFFVGGFIALMIFAIIVAGSDLKDENHHERHH